MKEILKKNVFSDRALNTLLVESNSFLRPKIVSSINLVSELLKNLRYLSKVLNTSYINTCQLSSSIENLLNYIESSGKFKTEFSFVGEEIPLDNKVKTVVYRIIQEAVNNGIKHSKGDKINVDLGFYKDDICLSISDNGIGLPEEVKKSKNGIGLNSMISRAKMIGAEIEIKGSKQMGTIVKLILPKSNTYGKTL